MNKYFVFLLFALAFFISCNSDYPGFDKSNSGLYYKFYIINDDEPMPQEGDIITVLLTYRIGDSILFKSDDLGKPFRFPLDPPAFEGDIFEGLAMMHTGDSATFIVAADSLKRYGNLPPLDSGTMLYFDVKLISIQKKADFEKEMALIKQQEQASLEKMKQMEEADIEAYVKNNNVKTKPTSSGLYIIVKKTGSGEKAAKGKVAEIHYSAKLLNGTKLFSTRDNKNDPIFFELGKDFEIPAIEEALLAMKSGGITELIVPSALAYGEQGIPDFVAPYSPLLFELELISVMSVANFKTKMEIKEQQDIKKYITDNNIKVPSLEGGIYYVELKRGAGPLAVAGKTVVVNYTGKFLNGKVFDSSNSRGGPVEFRLGAGEVIAGWEIGITMMNTGGRAKLIIPSKLAFGDEYFGSIPPYSPVIYEIELLSVK